MGQQISAPERVPKGEIRDGNGRKSNGGWDRKAGIPKIEKAPVMDEKGYPGVQKGRKDQQSRQKRLRRKEIRGARRQTRRKNA